MEATGRTALYRLYDADDQLLYVGVSMNPELRWMHHQAEKNWWPLVSRKEVEWIPTRLEALAAETRAIHEERPACNVANASPSRWGDGKKHRRVHECTPDDPRCTPEHRADRAKLAALKAEGQELLARRYAVREALEVEMLRILRDRILTPSEVAKLVGYDRNHVGRIGRAGGVPPLREATVVSKRKAAEG